MPNFTAADVITEARRLASVSPNHVYGKPAWAEKAVDGYGMEAPCLYLHVNDERTEGGCIFGQALLNLGMDAELLRSYESASIAKVLHDEGLVASQFTAEARWCTTAQGTQDEHETWAVAVGRADGDYRV